MLPTTPVLPRSAASRRLGLERVGRTLAPGVIRAAPLTVVDRQVRIISCHRLINGLIRLVPNTEIMLAHVLRRACAGAALAATPLSLLYDCQLRCISQEPPPPAVTAAEANVKQSLLDLGVPAEEAMRPLQLALRDGRVAARIILPDESAVLPALMPIIGEFPDARWRTERSASAMGESLVLERATSSGRKEDTGMSTALSIVAPFGSGSRLDANAVELELLVGAEMSKHETAALTGCRTPLAPRPPCTAVIAISCHITARPMATRCSWRRFACSSSQMEAATAAWAQPTRPGGW